MEGCAGAAQRIEDEPIGVEVARFARILERGCDAGDERSCRRLAQLLTESPVVPRDEARAEALFERSCKLGDGVSCMRDLGGPPLEAGASPADVRARLAPLLGRLEPRCLEGDAPSCILLSTLYLGIVPDEAARLRWSSRAEQLLEVACLRGDGEACLQGALLIGGKHLEPSAKAQRLIERGCELGEQRACTQWATQSLEMPDPQRIALLRTACDRGREDACLPLGRALASRQAPEAPATLLRAARLAEAKCRIGELGACDAMVEALPHAPLEASEARSQLDLAGVVCDRGVAVTCAALARALAALPPPLGDPARAAELQKKACALGYPFACPDPMAKLGFAARLGVPILDRRSGVMWAPQPIREVLPAIAPDVCERIDQAGLRDWRLPSKAELEALVEGGKLRPFARLTFPHHGLYFSSDLAPGGARWALDLAAARLVPEAKADGFAHCVRAPAPSDERSLSTLTLRMSGANLDYAIRDAKGKVLTAATIIRPAEAAAWAGSIDLDDVSGAVAVDVAPAVEWALAARFLERAVRDGLRLDHVALGEGRP